MGKRFIFACIAIVCVSVVAIMLKYDAKNFAVMVGMVTGIFTFGQTFTDHKKMVQDVG